MERDQSINQRYSPWENERDNNGEVIKGLKEHVLQLVERASFQSIFLRFETKKRTESRQVEDETVHKGVETEDTNFDNGLLLNVTLKRRQDALRYKFVSNYMYFYIYIHIWHVLKTNKFFFSAQNFCFFFQKTKLGITTSHTAWRHFLMACL